MHCLACAQPQGPKTLSEQHHTFLTSALYGAVLPVLLSSHFTKESTPELTENIAGQAPKSVCMICRKMKSPASQLLSHPACNPETISTVLQQLPAAE